jgi:hypothetical protein
VKERCFPLLLRLLREVEVRGLSREMETICRAEAAKTVAVALGATNCSARLPLATVVTAPIRGRTKNFREDRLKTEA